MIGLDEPQRSQRQKRRGKGETPAALKGSNGFASPRRYEPDQVPRVLSQPAHSGADTPSDTCVDFTPTCCHRLEDKCERDNPFGLSHWSRRSQALLGNALPRSSASRPEHRQHPRGREAELPGRAFPSRAWERGVLPAFSAFRPFVFSCSRLEWHELRATRSQPCRELAGPVV